MKGFLREELLDNEVAQGYINHALENNDLYALKCCLLEIIKARGKVPAIAKELGVTRQSIYNLSRHGRLSADRLFNIIKYLDIELHADMAS